MNKEVEFIIYGEPMAKQRPRATTYGKIARVYTPKDTINYENKVLSCYIDKLKELGIDTTKPYFEKNELIEVNIHSYFPLVKGDYGKKGLNKSGRDKLAQVYCPSKKDADNLAKIILDGLNEVAYVDDKQVVILTSIKYWTEDNARVEVKMKMV